MKNKGIVLIALGHPYYGRYAHNLAVTIKVSEPDMPIAVIHAGESISHIRHYDLTKTFDHIIEAPTEAYTTNGKPTYVKCKTFLYDLSPFDETIFIDADAVWLPVKKPSELFAELAGVDYSMANHEYFDVAVMAQKRIWGHLKAVKELWGMNEGKYFSLSSELIYFKKTEAVKKYFDTAQNVYNNPRIEPKKNTGKADEFMFANWIPDEFAFSVAGVICGIYPHCSPWHPSYWYAWHPNKIPRQEELQNNYYVLSAGGKFNPQWVKMMYNRLVAAAFNRLELRYPWRIQNKRSFLPERSKI